MASLTFKNSFFLGSGRPQTQFSSNVVFIFQRSLNVGKDVYLAEKNKSFWMFTEPDTISLFCLLVYMYFLFILLFHFVLMVYVPIL